MFYLDNNAIRTLSQNPAFVEAFPSCFRRASTILKAKSCGGCPGNPVSQTNASDLYLQIKLCIVGLTDNEKLRFKTMLHVDQVQVSYINNRRVRMIVKF